MPDQTVGSRPNLKQPSRRFGYKFGLNEVEDFFIYAAQFGAGMVLWGVVTPPGMVTGEPLSTVEHTVFGPTPPALTPAPSAETLSASDWEWLETLDGSVDADFAEATEEQPPEQERSGLSFFE